jgi:molybdate transport system regulatory protein
MHRLTIRIDFADGTALGPGKVRLLELVEETGSIRQAAARMRMSYRRAWLLLQSLAETFGEPLAITATGGKQGGGARLTVSGRKIAAAYRRLEKSAAKAGAEPLAELDAMLPAAAVAPGTKAKHGAKPPKRRKF